MAAEEAVFDSWEDFEDSGALDKHLDTFKVLKRETNSRIQVKEESGRTAFQPQIKILKREPGGGDASRGSGQQAPKPMKSLEQREAEYAEARQRILGAAYNKNDYAPVEGATATPAQTERPSHLIPNMEELKISDNAVVRQPKGPDGTKGFHVKR
ncbi:SUZ domain-containing protein 1-like [Liolophura sinensis]|uniref:SUZ domain-containing protein 1-like n=1 Tax=Liolophura sinensis TaxID=3198878 RepID=UPI0031584345